MDTVKIIFKKDKFWKKFIHFQLDRKSLGLNQRAEAEQTKPSSSPPDFAKIQEKFIGTHDTFFTYLPFQYLISEIHLNQLIEGKLRKFCKDNGHSLRAGPQTEQYEIPATHLGEFAATIDRIILTSRAAHISLDSSIMQLCSQFDILVSNIVATIIERKPEILNSSDRKIEYADLYHFQSLENIKAHFSEKFVEGLIRRSRAEQFAWFSQTLGIPMTKDLTNWPDFIEINERRNLLTHTGGIVSSAYLNNCGEQNYKFSQRPKVGDSLKTDFEYFRKATAIFFEIAIKLIQVTWRKFAPEEIDVADKALVNAGYNLIINDRIDLALEIHRFAVEVLKNVKSERSKRVLLVNYANCYNLLDKVDKAKDILSRMDWSATDLEFQVCVAAVSGNVDKVISLMKKSVSNENLTEEDFRTWPVFRKIHKEEKFKAAYKKVFNKELVSATASPKFDLKGLADFVRDWRPEERASPEMVKQILTQ